MIHYIYADQLANYPLISETMFRDRAQQFKHRLKWEVQLDENGWEVDEYDSLNPLYVIYEDSSGRHGGSIRIMPTVGRIMTNEHFLDLTGGVRIASPLIWECTRFCLAAGSSAGVAAALLGAGLELGRRFGLDQAVGVVYSRTLPLYRRIGWAPDVIGTGGEGREQISVGLWNIAETAHTSISERSGIPLDLFTHWFDASFSAQVPEPIAA